MSDTFYSPLTLLGAGASLAFSSIFYTHYKNKKIEIDKLKEIPIFTADQYLLKILNTSPDKRLHYVAVQGVVQPVGEPIASQFVPQCFGVVQKVITQDHLKVQKPSGLWVPKTENIKEMKNAVPFQLLQPGSYMPDVSVRVESPLEAKGDFLEQVHRRLRHVEEGLLDALVQGLSGEKLVAREEKEELLRVGAVLTGYGEVVLEAGGAIKLRPPRDGRAFIFQPGDHQSFIRRHQNTAGMWKSLTVLTGLTGVTLLTALLYGALSKDTKKQPGNL